MTGKMDRQNEMVGQRGWSPLCFDGEGRQIYTPETLAEAGRIAEQGGPCPPNVCIANRGQIITGSHAVDHHTVDDARATRFATAERANRVTVKPPARLGDGRIEVVMPVDSRSWIDVLFGRAK